MGCSEIASEAIFVFKFIFGLNAARILGPRNAACHVTRQSVTGSPKQFEGDTKEHQVSIQWTPNFEQKFSMERREEEKGRREKEMKSKMEGVIKEGNRERAKEKGFSEH